MNRILFAFALITIGGGAVALLSSGAVHAQGNELPKAFIDGEGPGWRELGEADFVNVNCAPDTWSFKDGMISCTGTPALRMRSAGPGLAVAPEVMITWSAAMRRSCPWALRYTRLSASTRTSVASASIVTPSFLQSAILRQRRTSIRPAPKT